MRLFSILPAAAYPCRLSQQGTNAVDTRTLSIASHRTLIVVWMRLLYRACVCGLLFCFVFSCFVVLYIYMPEEYEYEYEYECECEYECEYECESNRIESNQSSIHPRLPVPTLVYSTVASYNFRRRLLNDWPLPLPLPLPLLLLFMSCLLLARLRPERPRNVRVDLAAAAADVSALLLLLLLLLLQSVVVLVSSVTHVHAVLAVVWERCF